MKAKHRNYSQYNGDEVSQNTAALLAQAAANPMIYNSVSKNEPVMFAPDNLRAINDLAKRKQRQ